MAQSTGLKQCGQFVQQCCAIPFRSEQGKLQFCLVTSPYERNWSFPLVEAPSDDNGPKQVAEKARQLLGLSGDLNGYAPLGHFESSRSDVAQATTAYLLEVTQVDEKLAARSGHRHRWCLAEEAKLLIRRKPIRHLIDVAVRRLEGPHQAGAVA